jgi:hypothetical protein
MPSTFRIASYNVENLFERPRAMNLATWAEGKPILEQHARINELLNQAQYSAADKVEILDLSGGSKRAARGHVGDTTRALEGGKCP